MDVAPDNGNWSPLYGYYENYPQDAEEVYGIYVEGDLTIRPWSGLTYSDSTKNYGLSAQIEDAEDYGAMASKVGAGIYCTGKLTIDGTNATNKGGTFSVSAGGFGATGTNGYGYSYGIHAGNGIEIKNAWVDGIAHTALGSSTQGCGSYGIRSDGAMTVTDSKVTAVAGESGAVSTGLSTTKGLTVTGSSKETKVTATGGISHAAYNSQTPMMSTGIGGNVTAENAVVTATGGNAEGITYGINGSVTAIGSATVTATGGNAAGADSSFYSYGINGRITITASGNDSPTIEATGGNSTYNQSATSYGLYNDYASGVSVATGTVRLTGGDVVKGSSYGAYLNDLTAKLVVSGGKTYVTGGAAGTNSRGFSHNYDSRTTSTGGVEVCGGELYTYAKGNNAAAIYAKNVTVSTGKLIANASAGYAGDSAWTGGIIVSSGGILQVSGGTVDATGPEIRGKDGAGIYASSTDIEITGGSVTATGGPVDIATTNDSMGLFIYGGGLTISGGSLSCTGGNVSASAPKANSYGIYLQLAWSGANTSREYKFTGGTLTACGGTLGAANPDGSSYGLKIHNENTFRIEIPETNGTLMTFKGHTKAFPHKIDAGCVAASTSYNGSGAAALGIGLHSDEDLAPYKYVLAGTKAQMKAKGYEPTKRDIGAGGLKITLSGGVQRSTRNYFTYNQQTNKLDVSQVLIGETDITDRVTVTASMLKDGKPAYLNTGTYTVTATVKSGDAVYTGTGSDTYKVIAVDLSSCTLTINGAPCTYTQDDVYQGITTSLTGKDANGKSWTLTEGTDYTVRYSVTWTTGDATIAGTVKATASVTSHDGENYNFQAGNCSNTFTLLKAENPLTLKASTAESVIGGSTAQIDFGNTTWITDHVGNLSYAITQALTGCTIDANGNFRCGTTPGTCVVTITAAGNERYRAGSKTVTISVKEKDTYPAPADPLSATVKAAGTYTLDLTDHMPEDGTIKSAVITEGGAGIDGNVAIDGKKLKLTFKDTAEVVKLQASIGGGSKYKDYTLTAVLTFVPCEHALTKTAAKAATCEKPGNKEYYTCTKCKHLFKDQEGTERFQSLEETVIPALGHDWEEWTITRQPTETATGQESRNCKRNGCHKKETRDIPMVLAPKSVVISSTDLTDIVYVGETLGLSAQVIANRPEGPEEHIDPTVTWTSSDEKIATVTGAGTVTGVKAGTATITATATQQITLKDAQGKDKQKTITVKSTFKVTVRANKLTNDKLKLTIPVANRTQADGVDKGRVQTGRTVKLTPAFESGVDRADQALYWYSSDSTIATVSQVGLVMAKAPGTVTITAASQTQEHVSRSCDILVYDPVTTLKFDKTAISLGKEETYYGLTLTALPGTATDRRIQLTWPENSGSAADKRISVYGDDVDENGIVDLTDDDDGMVTLNVKAGDIAGRFAVTATALDGSGKKATCYLTVGNKVESLSIVEPRNQGPTLAAGKTIRLTPKFNNGIATNQPAVKTVEWKITAKDTSGNDVPEGLVSTIATIDKNGNLKAVGAGTINVSVKHIESNTVGDSSVSYRIYTPATRVAMKVKTITLKQGQSYTIGAATADTFGATVTPGTATLWNDETSSFAYSRDNLVWQVSNAPGTKDLVKIEGDKVVIGTLPGNLKRGTATLKVTAKSEGTPDKIDTCTITVLPSVAVSLVKLDKTAIRAGVGSIYELAATVTPATADQRAVKWSVSDPAVLGIAAFTPGVDQPENFDKNNFGTTAETDAGQALAIHVKSASNTSVRINAEAVSDSKKKAFCTVTVGNAVNGVTITQPAKTDTLQRLIVGRSQIFRATGICDTTVIKTARPANATVKWSFTEVKNAEGTVLDPSQYDTIATLNPATGAVKATGCGFVELTATSTETPYNGDAESAKVDIVTYVPVNKLVLSQTRVSIGEGKQGYLWLTEVGPANALDPAHREQPIEWSTNDKNSILVAAYTPGEAPVFGEKATTSQAAKQSLVFKAVGASTRPVTIKGITTDGSNRTVQCVVTILSNVSENSEQKEGFSLQIAKKGIALALLNKINVRAWKNGEWQENGFDTKTTKLEVTGLPVKSTLKLTSAVNASACDKTLVYRSSNPYIATVTAQGLITAKNPGQVTITLTSADGGRSATCEVTVAP